MAANISNCIFSVFDKMITNSLYYTHFPAKWKSPQEILRCSFAACILCYSFVINYLFCSLERNASGHSNDNYFLKVGCLRNFHLLLEGGRDNFCIPHLWVNTNTYHTKVRWVATTKYRLFQTPLRVATAYGIKMLRRDNLNVSQSFHYHNFQQIVGKWIHC